MKKVQHGAPTRALALVLVAALAALAAAAAASASPARHARQQATITIGLPGIPPVFLGVRPYVASQKGFYSKYGADVQIKDFTTGVDALRAVQSGQIDLAWAPTPAVLSAIAKGAPLVGIEGMDVVDWEVGSIDPKISTCSDLKGQTIGIDTVGGARYGALQAMLKKCNLTINDVHTVNFPGASGMQAMIAGQLKVNVLHVDEQAQIEKQTGKAVTIPVKLTDVDPYQHYDLLVSTKQGVQSHYFDYVHLLAGDIAATRWMYDPKNLDATAQIATVTGDTADVAAQALKKYYAMKWWPLDKSGMGYSRITRTIGLNVKLGNISPAANLTWKQVVDSRMWKAAWNLVNHVKPKAKKKK